MSHFTRFASPPPMSQPGQGRIPRNGSVESDTKPSSSHNSSSKRRPSRAGTRSVTTLSSAQLERKRANDREAQRAIRARTKEHIDQLTKQANAVKARADHNERLLLAAQHRIRQLEDELTFLKTRASAASDSFIVGNPSNEVRSVDSAISLESDVHSSPDTRFLVSEAPRTMPDGHRGSLSSQRTTHSSLSSGDWRSQPRCYTASPAVHTPTPETSRATSSWRGAQDSMSSGSSRNTLTDQSNTYSVPDPAAQDRQQWTANASYGYMLDTSQQHTSTRASPNEQQQSQQQYTDPNQSSFPVQSSMTSPQHYPSTPFTPALSTPASEFRNLSVHSPGDTSAVHSQNSHPHLHRHHSGQDLQTIGSAYTVTAGPATTSQDYRSSTSGSHAGLQQTGQQQQLHLQQQQQQPPYVLSTPSTTFTPQPGGVGHAQQIEYHGTSSHNHGGYAFDSFTAST